MYAKNRAANPSRRMRSVTERPRRWNGCLNSDMSGLRSEAQIRRVGGGGEMERHGAVDVSLHELRDEGDVGTHDFARGAFGDDAAVGHEEHVVDEWKRF